MAGSDPPVDPPLGPGARSGGVFPGDGSGEEIAIREASDAADYARGRDLIKEYAVALGFSLCFQNFAAEIADLPAVYGPPRGCLLIAHLGGEPVGCVAVRDRGEGACEMKRLYVKPRCRGLGLGRRLAEAAIAAGRGLGYERMVLDTLSSMTEALSLYRSLGFREVQSYYPNPLEGVHYLGREIGEDENCGA
ncbi:MAG: GNAT family N-acetyltransferase [Bacteroidota bacterium]